MTNAPIALIDVLSVSVIFRCLCLAGERYLR